MTMCLLVTSFFAAFASANAQSAPPSGAVNLRLDYGGAIALISALEQPELSDAEIATLLRVAGVRAMVENITRFVPNVGVAHFPENVKAFARTKRGSRHDAYFQFTSVWRNRDATRALIRRIRSSEQELMKAAMAPLDRYRLDSGPLTITAYFVAGGVSDGFVFDERADSAFYINLTRSEDDIDGLALNVAHEAYHVMQKAAQRRVRGLALFADSSERQPPELRLLTVTLAEGLANYAVDPLRSSATGAQIERSRKQFLKNAEPGRITENFALFDRVLRDLRARRASWEDAYKDGFSGGPDGARFYFVGYQMAKAIEQHCGTPCIAQLFKQPPIEFFRQYMALYRKHPDIRARFAPETEAFLSQARD